MVLVHDILWIEIKGHCMKIMLEDKEILWNKTLNDVEKELEKYDLIRCHRSFIIALGKIKEFTLKGVKMIDGNDIPIGRTYKEYLLEKYKNFILIN